MSEKDIVSVGDFKKKDMDLYVRYDFGCPFHEEASDE
jgi:hypothetical protein